MVEPICRYCNDKGCLCCAGERLRRQKEAELPQPIFVAKKDSESDMNLLRQFFGAGELERIAKQADGNLDIFSALVQKNAAVATFLQTLNAAKEGTERTFEKELEKELKKAPGILGRSQVTQEPIDMANGGVPHNFSDDFAEVKNDQTKQDSPPDHG